MNKLIDTPLFDCIAQSADDIYAYVYDPATRLTRYSKPCVDYFDLPSEYTNNSREVWLSRIHPDDQHIYVDDISAVMSGKTSKHHCQYRIRNRYGSYVWLECDGKMISDDEGKHYLFADLMKRIDNFAKYDPLTKLLAISELEYTSFSGRTGTMLLVALDHFRNVVSSFGLNFSERIIVHVATLLQSMCGKDDRLYQFAAHEFLFDLPGHDADYASELFTRIYDELSQVHYIGEHAIALSVSGGIAEYPKHADSRDDLVSYLELGLEYAKEHCRGSVVTYTRSLSSKQQEITDLRIALSESIQKGFKGFELYYQPIYSQRDTTYRSCECLLRWNHNEKVVRPDLFIPLLEDSGEIIHVGNWVMEEAIRTFVDWRKRGILTHMGFNTSPLQYRDTAFAERLIECGKRAGITPSDITVELTESYGVNNFQALKDSVEMLRKEGYRVSMDDFGMEHSTMALLRSIPVDSIKIDHTFVFGLRKPDSHVDHAMIQALINMAHQIGILVVAEGIEDEQLRMTLANMGADLMQGYLYSKPVPKEEFERLIG